MVRVMAAWACISAAPFAAAQAPPTNWLETRIAIEELAEAGDYAAALALEDRLLELAAAESDEDDRRVAEAHLLLARIQRESGDYTSAEQSVLAAIDVYEAEVGRLSPVLIDSFMALGDNYNEAGDYAAAISAWGEARTIGRRNYGLLNPDQLPIIDDMTGAAQRLGEIESARDLQREALVLIERVHGPDSPEALDARLKYAAWLGNYSQFFGEELRLYYEVERTIAEYYDNDPVMITRVMRERANSFRRSDNGDPLGIGGLRKALELLEEMPDPPVLLRAEVLVDIGDWNVEFGRTTGVEYLEAWRLLGTLENGDELREEWFRSLHQIKLGSLSRRYLSDDPEHPEGQLTISFTVGVTGRTREVRITDAKPPELAESRLANSAKSLFNDALFRPSIADGEFVEAPRIYRLDFRYQPPEE
jgi:tetratricopeptide (TPR) repeat protein